MIYPRKKMNKYSRKALKLIKPNTKIDQKMQFEISNLIHFHVRRYQNKYSRINFVNLFIFLYMINYLK